MLFAIDIGNSSISTGLFCIGSGELLYTFKLSSDKNRTVDEYICQISSMFYFSGIDKAAISGAIISSVVPELTHTMSLCAERIVGKKPKIVGPGLKTGFPIKVDNPSELGADLVSNAAAAISGTAKGQACIIVDMGTATTVSAINKDGEYIGNCILPGVKLCLDALHRQTAQLPFVTLAKPKKAIGKNSGESIRSGVVLGNAMMIDGFIDEFEKEMKLDSGAVLLATGGLAQDVLPASRHKLQYDPHLTLKGLYFIYKNNI